MFLMLNLSPPPLNPRHPIPIQPHQQGVQQQADGEAVRLYAGVPRLPAGLPAGAGLPRAAGAAAQLGALLPAPHDHLPGGGGAALRARRLGAHAEGLRGQGPAGVHPAHQPDHRQVQGELPGEGDVGGGVGGVMPRPPLNYPSPTPLFRW